MFRSFPGSELEVFSHRRYLRDAFLYVDSEFSNESAVACDFGVKNVKMIGVTPRMRVFGFGFSGARFGASRSRPELTSGESGRCPENPEIYIYIYIYIYILI